MITDLTVGHPKHTLWRFLLPMFISVMFQQLYNIADSSIAGRFAGEDALAAVGASYPITVIFMAFAVGSNLGASVVVSRLFGARDIGKMKSAVYTAFIACGLMSLILTVLGYVYCGSMMRLIHTPSNIFGDGELYLKIYVFGLTFLFLYNVCTGIFTALGDSRTPLYFLIGSSIGNILLDYWFVAKFHWGVAGVAWATFIAQGISAGLALVTLSLRLKGIKTSRRVVLFDLLLLSQIAAIAVPSIMQQSVLSVGNMFVQEIVNRYGSAVIAGYSGAIKLNTFAINAFMSLGGCLSSYTAQNLGAGKKERLPLGFKTGVRLSILVFCPLFWLQPADDGTVPGEWERGGNPIRRGLPAHCEPHVFHDKHQADDGWNHQGIRGNGILCTGHGAGFNPAHHCGQYPYRPLRQHGNLDGLALWMDCSYRADRHLLPEDCHREVLYPAVASGWSGRPGRRSASGRLSGPSCKCESFVNSLLWKHLSLEPEKCLC